MPDDEGIHSLPHQRLLALPVTMGELHSARGRVSRYKLPVHRCGTNNFRSGRSAKEAWWGGSPMDEGGTPALSHQDWHEQATTAAVAGWAYSACAQVVCGK